MEDVTKFEVNDLVCKKRSGELYELSSVTPDGCLIGRRTGHAGTLCTGDTVRLRRDEIVIARKHYFRQGRTNPEESGPKFKVGDFIFWRGKACRVTEVPGKNNVYNVYIMEGDYKGLHVYTDETELCVTRLGNPEHVDPESPPRPRFIVGQELYYQGQGVKVEKRVWWEHVHEWVYNVRGRAGYAVPEHELALTRAVSEIVARFTVGDRVRFKHGNGADGWTFLVTSAQDPQPNMYRLKTYSNSKGLVEPKEAGFALQDELELVGHPAGNWALAAYDSGPTKRRKDPMGDQPGSSKHTKKNDETPVEVEIGGEDHTQVRLSIHLQVAYDSPEEARAEREALKERYKGKLMAGYPQQVDISHS